MITLGEFLASKGNLKSADITHPDFARLYVRKDRVPLYDFGRIAMCTPCITLANIVVRNQRQGVFTQLVKFLVERDWAVYLENVHNDRFRWSLVADPLWVAVNQTQGWMFITNYTDKLFTHEPEGLTPYKGVPLLDRP